jgi:hypothetical protein
MSAYFDQAQVIQTTQTESQEDMGVLPGTESRVDLLFKSADWTKVSLSIGFQVNRTIRIEHIMKRGLFGGFGLGVEEVRGLG